MLSQLRWTSLLICMLCLELSAADDTFFYEQVVPIFQRRCIGCHSDSDQQGEFSVESAELALSSGLIEPGDLNSSRIIEVITPIDGKAEMPKNAEPMTDKEIETIRKWVQDGANWPAGISLSAVAVEDFDWWSLKPLSRPSVPAAASTANIRNPIDQFIQAKLEEKGLKASPEADRRTLIRRLYFDLLGIPPTPRRIMDFLSDPSPEAYERLVDELLSSKHYGERWARHWLDVVHYADTHGYDKDKLRPHAWPYRDYVIRALNEDKPYSRFVQEQLAGDVLWPYSMDGIVATGFIAAGPWDFIGHAEVPESKIDGRIARHLDRDDMVASTMNTFVSTTVQCARCHNHKFDPINQEHYYSLQSVFAALDRVDRPYDENPGLAQRRAALRQRKGELEQQVAQIAAEIRSMGGAQLADDYLGKIEDGHADIGADKQAEQDGLFLKGIPEWLRTKAAKTKLQMLEINTAQQQLPPSGMVYAATIHHGSGAFKGTGENGGKPRTIHVLHRGEVLQPRGEVSPGRMPLSAQDKWRFELDDDHTEGDRRVALANWIVDERHPLTWRSIVNRVWQYHFGRGIVDTPNDFGRMGAKPSHPELLDWLAVEFRDGGQSLKNLHKMIVTSATYRQTSAHDVNNAMIDSSNQYLWRMNRRRLSAEEIRDAVLCVSGKLNTEMYGPGVRLFALERPEHSPHYEYHKHDPDDPTGHRRTIYRFIVRSQPDPFMTTLDCADSSQSVAKRNETVTALQALSMLNNKFMLAMSGHFAARVNAAGQNHAEQVRIAFELALGHAPTAKQQEALSAYADNFGLENTCRLIFNLNEFVFID